MFLAIGSRAYVAAIFHMVTHAFFKAVLFLGAGAVIHGLHDEQDMKRMGALRKWMPITAVTFIAGWLAIAGIPPFAGFWSKDDILINAWEKSHVLWAVGVVTAGLTAYYMSRQVFLVFFGDERWRAAQTSHADEHAVPHEAPWTMALPLLVLGGLSVVGGVLNLPFKSTEVLGHWLDPVFGTRLHELASGTATKSVLLVITTLLALTGVAIAYAIFLQHRVREEAVEPVVLRRGWYVDELYSAVIETPGRLLFAWSAFVLDRKVVDGIVNGVGTLVRSTGDRLRKIQTGYVRNYALGIAVGAILVAAFMLSRVGIS
jgi:NADH-quinone oxidoreductase subunit L